MTSHEKFELAMQAELRYANMEYSAIRRGDYEDADRCHKMRWRMMDKALEFVSPEHSQKGGAA